MLSLVVTSACGRLSRFVPCFEHRHSSGIAVVCPDDLAPYKAASTELLDAVRSAYELAWANPEFFGYPAPDFRKSQVVVRVVRPEAEALVRQWTTSGIAIAFPKQSRWLAPPNMGVQLESATRSVAQLLKIQDDVGPNLADVPDASAIYDGSPDWPRNATRFLIDRKSDALLKALAARYGKDALVVEVRSRPNVGY